MSQNFMARKVQLCPTSAQHRTFLQYAGTARFAYNWGLFVRQQAWDHAKIQTNSMSLVKILSHLKREHPGYMWLAEVSSCVPNAALRDLDDAYESWWRRLRQRKRGGYPRFKSRARNGVGGFRLACAMGTLRVEREQGVTYIRLPRIGRVRLTETDYLPEGSLAQVTIKERAGRWYAITSIPVYVQADKGQRKRSHAPVGIDLGVSVWATFSDGTAIDAPRYARRALRRRVRLERERSRRRLGSANRAKTNRKLARHHDHVANQRKDALHKLTTKLATTRSGIVIEGLNAQDMGKNHILASSVRDAAFGMFREMLTYKCDWYGCGLEVAPRFFPSTQTCSECGTVKTGTDKLTLSQRTFRCDACGFTLGRDVNAARVLAAMYGSEVTIKVAASWAETVNACGAESTDIGVGSRCETRRGEAGTRIYSGRRP